MKVSMQKRIVIDFKRNKYQDQVVKADATFSDVLNCLYEFGTRNVVLRNLKGMSCYVCFFFLFIKSEILIQHNNGIFNIDNRAVKNRCSAMPRAKLNAIKRDLIPAD